MRSACFAIRRNDDSSTRASIAIKSVTAAPEKARDTISAALRLNLHSEINILPLGIFGEGEIVDTVNGTTSPDSIHGVVVRQFEDTFAILAAVHPLSIIHRPIFTADELTFTMTLVGKPLPVVTISIGIQECPVTVGLVVRPLPLETVTAGVSELT